MSHEGEVGEFTPHVGALTCDCGAPARSYCGVDNPDCTLVHCGKPVCGERGGHLCKAHRHAMGTMGWPTWRPSETIWLGYAPDEPGIWAAIKAKWKELTMSPQQAAQQAWDDVKKQFEAPAPLPPLRLRVGKRLFEARGEQMAEVRGEGE